MLSNPVSQRSKVQSISSTTFEQHSLWLSIVLHLSPGILNGILFFLLAPLIREADLPPFVALSVSNLLVLPPFILGLLLYEGNKRSGQASPDGVVLYRETVRWQEYLIFVPIVLVACPALILSFSSVTKFIMDNLFWWWPEAYNLAANVTGYPRSTLLFAYSLNFLSVSLVAPILEEIYFRGYLLPRLSRFGWWAIPINSTLFALFHFWTPWLVVARVIGLIPLIWVVHKKQNIYVGMIAHVLVNSLDLLVSILPILGQA